MTYRAFRIGLILSVLIPAVPAAAEDYDPRFACWEGNLEVCELGLQQHPGDVRWLAMATWAYSTSDQPARALEIRALLSRALNKLGYSYGAVQRVAMEDLEAGRYQAAVMAYTALLDFEQEAALLTEINHTGGNPASFDEVTQRSIDTAIEGLRYEAYEGRGLARIMSGNADEGLADLRTALEYGHLRRTLRLIERLGLDYRPQRPFRITEIDADLERLLREIADAQAQDQ